jgi:hypothetical protein
VDTSDQPAEDSEFKRLLESLPVQPVIGRRYQMRCFHRSSVQAPIRWMTFTVVGFHGHGRRTNVVVRRIFDDNDEFRMMTVFQWKKRAQKGSIRESVWRPRRFQTVAPESTLAAHRG